MNRYFQLPVGHIQLLRIHCRKKYQKEDRRGKNVQPDGIEIGSTPTLHIFARQKAWFAQEQADSAEEFSVEMGDIVEEMGDQAPHCIARLTVFLAANMTIITL